METGCKTFWEKCFENYFATVLKWHSKDIATVSSVRNYNIRFREVLRGNAYATIISVSLKNGFRFAKKR
jgi:hypothetical protein